jgi:hypothetical protein
MAKKKKIKKLSPTASLYLNLFDSVTPRAIEVASAWDFVRAIHRPLNNLLGYLIPDSRDLRLANVAKHQFVIASRTRGLSLASSPRDFTFRYEMGSAPSLVSRNIGTTLLQRAFVSHETFINIGNTTADPSTMMIVIFAYNTNIVLGPNEAIIEGNHTPIVACTFHLFPKDSPKVCFVSYLAVTDQLYNTNTVTGKVPYPAELQDEPPFRGNGYGFARLVLRMASLVSGSRFDAEQPDSGCKFLPIVLQTQMDSASRSCFHRLGFVHLTPGNNNDLKIMDNLSPVDMAKLNFQPTGTHGVETLGIFGKLLGAL